MKRFILWVFSGVVLTLSANVHAERKTVDEEMTIPSNARVVVETMRGDVMIKGTDQNVAHVKGKLDEHAERFIFELNGDTLTIKVEMPKRGRYNDNDGNELTISLPSTARVEAKGVSVDFSASQFTAQSMLKTVSGDIKANDLTGGAKLESVSGDIRARNLAGEIALSSVSGDVSDSDSDSRRATYASVSGDVRVSTNAAVVRAESVSGDVELALQTVESLQVNSVSGDVTMKLTAGPQARINVESVSGDVNAKFNGSINADITIETSAGGSIHNKLSNAKPQKSPFGIGEQLELELGERSGSMRFGTVSGNVTLSN